MRLPFLKRTLPQLKIRFGLLVIICLAALAFYLDLPKIPLKFSFGSISINRTIEHPSLKLGSFNRDLNPKLGLDLKGGTHIVLEADMSSVPKDQRDQALAFTRNVIERRVNLFGVSEPVVQTSKSGNTYRIVVELAGIKDINEAVAVIGKTAKLEFRQFTNTNQTMVAPDSTVDNTEPTGLDGSDLASAEVIFDPQTSAPEVGFKVASGSQDKFYKVTQSLLGKPMIIVLDGQPVSAPTVQAAIRDSGQITGNFTLQQAKDLALELNAGSLKAPVKIVSQSNVGATLGSDSIKKSIIAGAVGGAIIAFFMIANYGLLGVIADLALIVYTLVTFAVFKFIPITLTLAGIAGFILSIGMAVDANILIFERMKEEVRWGKSQTAALTLGFDRAMSSIKASNISTLITTAILYTFGTGLVRGFALTLAIGVLLSMFSAITVTKTFLKALYRI